LAKLSLTIDSLRDTKWATMVSMQEGCKFKVTTFPRKMENYPGMDSLSSLSC
jgi:hypothetical protein